jgi:hypothetical protein
MFFWIICGMSSFVYTVPLLLSLVTCKFFHLFILGCSGQVKF